MKYLRDQLTTKGVARVAPGDRGPGAPEPAVPPVVAGPLHLTDVVHEVEHGSPEVASSIGV